MDGSNVDPTGLQVFNRVARRCTEVILDAKFDIFTLQTECEEHLMNYAEWSNEFDDSTYVIDIDKVEIPDDIMKCEKDGLNWIACAAARHCKGWKFLEAKFLMLLSSITEVKFRNCGKILLLF